MNEWVCDVAPAYLEKMLKAGVGKVQVLLPDSIADLPLEIRRVPIFQFGDASTFIRLERDENYCLSFFYTTTGLGTQVAKVPLAKLVSRKHIRATLSWSPEKISMSVGGDSLNLSVDGAKSPKIVMPNGPDGVLEIGSEGVEVASFKIFSGDELVAKSSAISAWKHMQEGCRVLLGGNAQEEYLFEVIQRNFCIVMLVTGFEAYCKERFVEMEREGFATNEDGIVAGFFSMRERDSGEVDILKDEARAERNSLLQKMVATRRIDFQNWDSCKKAYNKAYGIRFSELGVSEEKRKTIQKFIKYRHRIVHVSPMEAVLEVGGREPVFCTTEGFCEEALLVFDDFVKALHAKTVNRT